MDRTINHSYTSWELRLLELRESRAQRHDELDIITFKEVFFTKTVAKSSELNGLLNIKKKCTAITRKMDLINIHCNNIILEVFFLLYSDRIAGVNSDDDDGGDNDNSYF